MGARREAAGQLGGAAGVFAEARPLAGGAAREPSPLSRPRAPPLPPQPSLLDNFEYGMCGKVFRYDYDDENRVAIIASFGGLLMQLKGDLSMSRLNVKSVKLT